jgi:hypothetical protein
MRSKRWGSLIFLAVACLTGGCLKTPPPLAPFQPTSGCVPPKGVTLTASGSGILFGSCIGEQGPTVQSAVLRSQAQFAAFFGPCVTPLGTGVNTTCNFNTQMMVGVREYTTCDMEITLPQACYFPDHIEVTVQILTDESGPKCNIVVNEDFWISIPTSNLPVDLITTTGTY